MRDYVEVVVAAYTEGIEIFYSALPNKPTPFGFEIEPSVERVLQRNPKGSTCNQKGDT